MNASNCRGTCVFVVLFGKIVVGTTIFPATFPAHHERSNGVMPPYGPYARYRTGTIANGWYVQVPVSMVPS